MLLFLLVMMRYHFSAAYWCIERETCCFLSVARSSVRVMIQRVVAFRAGSARSYVAC